MTRQQHIQSNKLFITFANKLRVIHILSTARVYLSPVISGSAGDVSYYLTGKILNIEEFASVLTIKKCYVLLLTVEMDSSVFTLGGITVYVQTTLKILPSTLYSI